jgi:hypothetical protein
MMPFVFWKIKPQRLRDFINEPAACYLDQSAKQNGTRIVKQILQALFYMLEA